MCAWLKQRRIYLIVVVFVLAAVAYAGGRYWWPDPHWQSERIVREFVADVSREAGRCRRALRKIPIRAAHDLTAGRAAVDARVDEAIRGIDQKAEAARARIARIEDELAWRTVRNRMQRIDRLAREAKEYIGELKSATQAKLAGAEFPQPETHGMQPSAEKNP